MTPFEINKDLIISAVTISMANSAEIPVQGEKPFNKIHTAHLELMV